MSISNKNWKKARLTLAYFIPVILIIIVYLSNRSLFLDSLNLARNIAESSFSELASPLKYQQSAPLLFLYSVKCITLAFGVSEYTLRFLPLLSGLGCLFFFGCALKRLLKTDYVLIGVFWLGTHSMFLRYATEFKQYMTDAFVCIFLIWLALGIDRLTRKNTLIIGILGAVSIWLSMPSIFVLVGLIGYYFHKQYKSRLSPIPVIILSLWFALNFVLEYFLILLPAIDSNHMQNFHQNYFLDGAFWKLDSLKHDFGLIVSTIRLAVGKSGIAIGVALVLILSSINDFIRKRESVGLLLVLPLIAVFGASFLEKYSLIERLMLFTLPILFFLILKGVNVVFERLRNKTTALKYPIFAIISLAFLIGFVQTNGFKYLINPLEIEDNRSALNYIDDHAKSSNSIICTQLAYPAYSYYTMHDKNHKSLNLGKAVGAKYGDSIVKLAVDKCKKDHEDVWVLMGHMQENEISKLISDLEGAGEIKNSYRTNHSAAILFFTQ